MSEETAKITTILKEKAPKTVEAGKRLAQLNKERKLHKEQQIEIDENKSNSSSAVDYSLILNVIGVTVAVVSLYYVRKKCNKKVISNDKPQVVKEEKPPSPASPLLDSLE